MTRVTRRKLRRAKDRVETFVAWSMAIGFWSIGILGAAKFIYEYIIPVIEVIVNYYCM